MTYSLSPRQQTVFHGRFNLYRPVRANSAASSLGAGAADQVELAYSNVRGRHEPRKEGSSPGPIGRQDIDILDTIDLFRLHVDQEIESGWYVENITPGDPLFGEFYKTAGGTMTRIFRAKELQILMKKTTRPPMVIS